MAVVIGAAFAGTCSSTLYTWISEAIGTSTMTANLLTPFFTESLEKILWITSNGTPMTTATIRTPIENSPVPYVKAGATDNNKIQNQVQRNSRTHTAQNRC